MNSESTHISSLSTGSSGWRVHYDLHGVPEEALMDNPRAQWRATTR